MRIIPYLVAIIVAIGMFRASGAMEKLTDWLRTPMQAIGVPPEMLPMAIVRPLSGSGSLGGAGRHGQAARHRRDWSRASPP